MIEKHFKVCYGDTFVYLTDVAINNIVTNASYLTTTLLPESMLFDSI